MWDPSIVWHNGKFHAFMMYAKQGRNGLEAGHCLLATSTDGVHWRTEGVVNEERELPPATSSSSALSGVVVTVLSWTTAWPARAGRT